MDKFPPVGGGGFSRRHFLKTTALAGAGMMMMPDAGFAQASAEGIDDLNVAMIGVGKQGKILLTYLLKIPGIRIKAVVDIWSYGQRLGEGICRKSEQSPNVYIDYRDMLASETDLDAAVIATPDFSHHEITNACLKAGLHVYCEKEMSNDLEKARSMVKTAQETGKLLQIGHQRRSNPYYRHAYNLMHKDKVFGPITTVNGQWNQQKMLQPVPSRLMEKYALPQDIMDKFGYESMAHFYYWRWFKEYAGGPMTDLGSHQVDVFNWYLNAPPKSVYAIGSAEHAVEEAKKNEVGYTPECFDQTLTLYEWDTPEGGVKGFYQVNLTTSHGGFFEEFMGMNGSMTISEIRSKSAMFKERTAETLDWEDEAEVFEVGGEMAMTFDPLKSRKAKGQMDEEGVSIEADLDKPVHQPHLENFFEAIRDSNVALTCPGEVGFETCVAVLKANESATRRERMDLQPGDFIA